MTQDDARYRLLAAGERLAAQRQLPELTAAGLASEAGLPPQAVEQLFGDLDGYLVALQLQFMTQLRDVVLQAATAHAHSAERLREGGIAYLDRCLQQHSLRRWFLQARRQTAVVAEGLRRQDQPYLLMLALEFKGLNWPHPQAAARLFLAQLQAVGHEEHAVNRALPDLRAALWDFLDTYNT